MKVVLDGKEVDIPLSADTVLGDRITLPNGMVIEVVTVTHFGLLSQQRRFKCRSICKNYR